MPSSPITVLAVDDEPDLCVLTKEFLEVPGELDVDTVRSVREAWEKLETRRYAAIVCDYQMPDEDGIQFLKSLRSKGDKTPFILFTGKGREEVALEALNNGADAYLQKGGEPVSQYVELGHRIRSLVRRHRSEEAQREGENRYRTLVEHSPMAIFVNRDDKVVMVNRECLRLFGANTPGQIVGLSIYTLFHPDFHAIVRNRIHELRIDGNAVPAIKEKIIRLDGRIVDVEVSAAPFMDQGINSIHVVLRDITDRKKAEEELKESEERFRNIADNTFEGIAINIDGVVVDANRAMCEILGYEPGELAGKRSSDLLAPGSRDKIHGDALDTGSSTYEVSAIKKDGNFIPLRLRGKRIEWKGKKARLIAVQNITEQKQAEAALKRSEEKYRSYIQYSSTPFLVADSSSNYIDSNQATCDLLGYDRDELLGMNVHQITAPGETQALESGALELKMAGSATQEMKLRKKDGTLIPVIVEAVYLPDGNCMAFFTDISNLKLVEADLRKKTALFEAQVASSIDGILVIDENFKRILVNKRIVELYDVPQSIMDTEDDNYLLEHVMSLTKYPEQFLEKVNYLNDHLDETSRDEIEFRNGMVLDRYSAPVLGRDGKYYGRTWTFRDITERKRAEAALLAANRKLNLLSSMTRHDINNQILILKGQIALMKINQPSLASNEHLRKSEIAAGQITAMVQFTKAYEDIGINAPIWQDLRSLVMSSAGDVVLGPVKVINDIPEGTRAFADPLIMKVFHNLIHNAVRHGNGITTIRFYLEERNGVCAVVCEDNGEGVPAGMKEKLFIKGSGRDHGLGLFLSREILAITGIAINHEGEPGYGARFVMTFPPNGLRVEADGVEQ